MFRARKGSKKSSKARKVDEEETPAIVVEENALNEEADENVGAVLERIKQKNKKPADFSSKKRPVAVVLDHDQEETSVPEFRVKKGKIPRMYVPTDEDGESRNEYSAEKLEELKAQQKFTSSSHFTAPLSTEDYEMNPEARQSSPEVHKEEETFIPLSESPRHEEPRRRTFKPEGTSLDDDEDNVQNQDDGGSDDSEWEAEQLRRVGLQPASHTAAVPTKEKDLTYSSLGQLLVKLTAHKSSLVERCDVRSREAQRVEVEMNQLTASIAAMEASLSETGAVYDDIQALWEFLSALCHCLRAKTKEIDRLEENTAMSMQPRTVQLEIWADVDDEYSSLSSILARFAAWKEGPHGAMYKTTYGDLALQQLVVPYIRIELLSYNPWLHRWEDLSWAIELKQRVNLDLLHIGLELVVARATKMVFQLDWLSERHIHQAQYLLSSVPASMRRPLEEAIEDHARNHAYDFAANATAASFFKKHVVQLGLTRLNSLVVQLLHDELEHVKTRQNLEVETVKAIVDSWPIHVATKAKATLREYATLVNQITDDSVAKRALSINIELKLQHG
ncbi:GC-rich sequence DNA-binding factor [Aphanomyces cochlioides]|nr:GC-rich sequence DNA-binding factor [Aphanomyces cochlioides]